MSWVVSVLTTRRIERLPLPVGPTMASPRIVLPVVPSARHRRCRNWRRIRL